MKYDKEKLEKIELTKNKRIKKYIDILNELGKEEHGNQHYGKVIKINKNK